jgi:2-polyprenyl-3-methyl-5-hydroxy-6-metoxy-1,4-benzoquinol methylase
MRDTRYDELFWNEQHNWWYRNRRLLVYDLLRKYDVPFVAEILDVGCGTGLLLQELCERGYKHVVGLDNSRRALAYCRARNLPAVFMADAVATGCAASSFDVVLLLDVLEHITMSQKLFGKP